MILYKKPIELDLVDYSLYVNGNQHPQSARTFGQMKKVLLKANFPEAFGSVALYHMYRKVYFDSSIRFDITVIPQQEFGEEFPKTLGHYHPKSPDGLDYPELYQVLAGRATFVLQKKNSNQSVDALIVDATAGEVVLLPPGFGHVSINSGSGVLILSNLVSDKFESVYSEYEQNQGAAYYYLRNGEISQNTSYIIRTMARTHPAKISKFYGFSSTDLLSEFHSTPQKFEFLNKPSILFKR